MKKLKTNENWLIADKRNHARMRLMGIKSNIEIILGQVGKRYCFTGQEEAHLRICIDFLDDIINKNWKKNYNEIRKQHNFKTYENI